MDAFLVCLIKYIWSKWLWVAELAQMRQNSPNQSHFYLKNDLSWNMEYMLIRSRICTLLYKVPTDFKRNVPKVKSVFWSQISPNLPKLTEFMIFTLLRLINYICSKWSRVVQSAKMRKNRQISSRTANRKRGNLCSFEAVCAFYYRKVPIYFLKMYPKCFKPKVEMDTNTFCIIKTV